MKNKKHPIVAMLMAAPLIYLAIVWSGLPQTIPVHFNLQGTADRYGSKNTLLIAMLVVSIVNGLLYLLLCNMYRFDPKKRAIENKSQLQNIAFAVTLFMAGIQIWIIYISGTKEHLLSVRFVLTGVCILFSILGNYMYNIKPNYFAGLRLPWTLENEDNWRKTHHYASRLWFGGGLVAALFCLVTPSSFSIFILVAMVLIMIILPTLYSYRLYKRMKV